MADERAKFLLKHDRVPRRLSFLWGQKDLISEGAGSFRRCACFGGTRFFADRDAVGLRFFDSEAPLAATTLQNQFQAENSQPAFFQSILTPHTK